MSDWFVSTFGVSERAILRETGFEGVRQVFSMEGETLLSRINNRRFEVGRWEQLSLADLRSRVQAATAAAAASAVAAAAAGENQGPSEDLHGGACTVLPDDTASFRNLGKANAATLHQDGKNEGAVFQVASQFNCLEMVGPGVTPEHGVTIYEKVRRRAVTSFELFFAEQPRIFSVPEPSVTSQDHTQGPACALACPAATVFRNYFVNGHGQAHPNQIDMLDKVGRVVDNHKHHFWDYRNGYVLPTSPDAMARLGTRLKGDSALRATAQAALQVGVHWSTAVTLKRKHSAHKVTQVFCSALPVAYAKSTKSTDWEPFARLVLEAAYEATLLAALVLSVERGGARVRVFLTMLGGGAFGNRRGWIYDAIERAYRLVKTAPLDVILVHFGPVPGDAQKLATSLR